MNGSAAAAELVGEETDASPGSGDAVRLGARCDGAARRGPRDATGEQARREYEQQQRSAPDLGWLVVALQTIEASTAEATSVCPRRPLGPSTRIVLILSEMYRLSSLSTSGDTRAKPLDLRYVAGIEGDARPPA